MSVSILPPGPGIAKCPGLASALPKLVTAGGVPLEQLSPSELKSLAIETWPNTGLGKRECSRLYGRGWSTVKGWLNPLALDRTPHPRFVRWLVRAADARRASLLRDAELEAV